MNRRTLDHFSRSLLLCMCGRSTVLLEYPATELLPLQLHSVIRGQQPLEQPQWHTARRRRSARSSAVCLNIKRACLEPPDFSEPTHRRPRARLDLLPLSVAMESGGPRNHVCKCTGFSESRRFDIASGQGLLGLHRFAALIMKLSLRNCH